MALAGKKSGNMHNLSGSNKAKLQAKFDENFHDAVTNDPDSNPMLASIVYTLQNVTEDIDSLRSYAGTEIKGLVDTNTEKSTTNVSAISTMAFTNNTKGTISFGAPAKNGDMTIQVVVGKNIFTYTLSADGE